MRFVLPALVLLLLAPPASAEESIPRLGKGFIESEGDLPAYDAANPAAPPVTRENLPTSDRFWPFRVRLTRSVQVAPVPMSPVPAGVQGVLVRVEVDGRARLDLGRDGVANVPAAHTDILERANEIRTGETVKRGPNLMQIMGAHTVDSVSGVPKPFDEVASAESIALIVADPSQENFAKLARELSAVQAGQGVFTVLLPLGRTPTGAMTRQLREIDWRVPFIFDHTAEGLAEALLPDGASQPTLLLLSKEGRLLYQADWKPGSQAVPGLAKALSDLGSAQTASNGS